MKLINVTPDLPDVLRALSAAPCWAAERGYGSFLTFDFGARTTRVGRLRTYEVGEVHLWIYMAAWNLKVDGRRVGWCSAPEKKDGALQRFIGRTITGLSEHPACLYFSGEGDARITLNPLPEYEDEHEHERGRGRGGVPALYAVLARETCGVGSLGLRSGRAPSPHTIPTPRNHAIVSSTAGSRGPIW
jgi:hypothetical protein